MQCQRRISCSSSRFLQQVKRLNNQLLFGSCTFSFSSHQLQTASPTTPSRSMNSSTNNQNSTQTDFSATHELITEGQISMLYPKSENSVFYNPVQVQNRDLSILMIGMYAERRMEKKWTQWKKKELRREMFKNLSDDHSNEKEVLTKEQTKAKNLQIEKEIKERLEKDKSTVDFVKLVKESTAHCSDRNSSSTFLSTCSGWSPGLTILEALAASGLRSLRYWKEIPGVRTVVVNDLDPVAIELARENVVRNRLEPDLVDEKEKHATNNLGNGESNLRRPSGIILQVGDAKHEMYVSQIPPTLYPDQQNSTQRLYQKPQYDVIDLDPYGSASSFLDAA